MKVLPKMEVKKFDDCGAGELVRFLNWGSTDVGLIGKRDDGKSLFIALSDSDVELRPGYWLIERQHQPDGVVSYGTNYHFEVGHRGNIDLSRTKLWSTNGALFLWKQRWTMRVCPAHGRGLLAAVHYDLETGMLVDEPSSVEVAVFGEWSLHLQSETQDISRIAPLVTVNIATITGPARL